MFEYYLLDWVSMALAFLSVWLLGNRVRAGFVVFSISNLTWVGVGVLAGSYGMIVGNLVFLIVNIRGYLKWSPQSKD